MRVPRTWTRMTRMPSRSTPIRPSSNAYGCLETSPDELLPARLKTIHRFVSDLVALHRPQLVGVERLFFSRNAQTAFAVGQARGVVLLAAADHDVPVRDATPNEVK